jgi:hypothetical protein
MGKFKNYLDKSLLNESAKSGDVIVRWDSEADSKIYKIPSSVAESLKKLMKNIDETGLWDDVNELMDEHFTKQNEIKIDYILNTTDENGMYKPKSGSRNTSEFGLFTR